MSEVNGVPRELSADKRALLLKLLRGRSGETPANVMRGAQRTSAPLSSGQQRLWALEQILGETSAYNVPIIRHRKQRIEPYEIAAALKRIVARHEVLRTVFTIANELPVQEVVPEIDLTVAVNDLRDTNEAKVSAAQDMIDAFVSAPFDLVRGPLLRAMLLRLPRRDVVVFVLHHIVTDARSIGILNDEFDAIIEENRGHRTAVLPPLPLQYADYALWQAESRDGEPRRRQLRYWVERLAGLEPLELPTTFSRPSTPTFRGARADVEIEADLAVAVRKLASEQRVTPFVVLLAAFEVLLSRYSGRDDISVGVPVEGRNLPEFEHLVGFFVNSIVLRTDLSGDPSFRGVVARIWATTQGALVHQDVPFEEIVNELRPERDLSRNPLFQNFFQLQSVRAIEARGQVQLTTSARTAKFDLALELVTDGTRIKGWFEYSTDIFDRAMVLDIERHYRALLRAALHAPDSPVTALPMLTAAERDELECRSVDADIASATRDRTIVDVIADQASRTPDRHAAQYGDHVVTYAELDAWTVRIARALRADGVETGDLVVVAHDRGLEMLAALLGTLRAGAAFLPLDPALPAERVRAIVDDARPVHLLAGDAYGSFCSSAGLSRRIDAARLRSAGPGTASATDGGARPAPSDTAYVIYTSGSTGGPKGVRIAHASLLNFMLSMAREVDFNANDRLLALTMISFDIAILELFLPLTVGALVIIGDRFHAADAVALKRYIDLCGATVLQGTPSLWRLLREAEFHQDVQALTAICGGEPLPWDLGQWLRSVTRAAWNVYGPTETTIWSAARRIEAGDRRTVLGGPLANTEIRIVDRNLHRVPRGVVGEVLIGGAGVALGYVNRPELDNARFIDDRERPGCGNRLFRTGDLARFVEPGAIEFIGRRDFQIKIRGFRVELGEIEDVVRRVPRVSQCVVLKGVAPDGHDRLVAYVRAPDDLDVDALRAFVKRFLPDYMVPEAVVTLRAFALTPSGKIDRQALARLTPAAPRTRGAALQTVSEQRIATIWSELLGVEARSLEDNFFDMGGTSFSLIRASRMLSQEFAKDVAPIELFRNPTIASLAAALDRA